MTLNKATINNTTWSNQSWPHKAVKPTLCIIFYLWCLSAWAVTSVKVADLIATQQSLEHIKLEIEDKKSSLKDNVKQRKIIEKEYALLTRFVFTPSAPLIEQLNNIPQQKPPTTDTLTSLHHGLTQALKTSELIRQTIEAEQRADLTQADAKMYFMMRVRSEIPAKTLKAFGLMALATQQRDQGQFQAALDMWQQAETLVREAFNEHIQHMAEWRENAKRNAHIKRQHIRVKVQAWLKDHFVSLPGGEFTMGNDTANGEESPAHTVRIPPFLIGKTEVTFTLYDYCVEDTHCYSVPNDQGWGREDRPVINVSHKDINKQFLPWLNTLTGQTYRLPTEAEWEYAARANTQTDYAFGNQLACSSARFDGGATSVCNAKLPKNQGTLPVASFAANAFGLFDMHGNTREWVADCWNTSYQDAPTDGSAWLEGNCRVRVMRGGSWRDTRNNARSSSRQFFTNNSRKPYYGFRLVREAATPR